jgi:4-aminobutyrate aminotransferase/(S)-3-amino-2-methylpropionate transaminase
VSADDLSAAADRFVLHALRRSRRLLFERARGVRVWDIDGREYLDAVSGTNGPALVGHAHPRVTEAVARQMAELPSTFIIHDSVPLVRFAGRMAAIAPPGLTKTFLCPGGGEAVEAAVKLACRITGRTGVVSLQGAYHGMSLGTMSLGGIRALREWFPGGVHWPTFRQVAAAETYRPPLGTDVDSAVRALESSLDAPEFGGVAALVIELVQGPGGHVVFAADYYREAQRVCRERDVLLIVDEVQTALGRCGRMWACDVFDVAPDMIAVGKAFGGGFPFGGIVVRAELIDDEIESDPWHILTFMNQPLQAAAGLAVIDVVEDEKLVERGRRLGEVAREHLKALAKRYAVIGDVRGPGLFIGVDLVRDRQTREPATDACLEGWEFALDRGLLTWFGGAGNVLKFKPPLVTSDDELAAMLDRVEETIAFIDRRVRGRKPGAISRTGAV